MFRSLRLGLTVALSALLMIGSFAAAEPAPADVAFKISGGGVGPDGLSGPGDPPKSHWSVGQATHLGRYSGDGFLKTDTFSFDPSTGVISGDFGSATPYVFTAPDGSELVTWYGNTDHGAAVPGHYELTIVAIADFEFGLIVVGDFVAEFVIDGAASTGRFAGASGSWIMHAHTDPFLLGSSNPLPYTWEGEGRINLK